MIHDLSAGSATEEQHHSGMASLPWPPWASTNRTETLSPAQIERILQMHKESKHNAVIYVLVVLVLYLVALAVLIGRYLHQERDPVALLCIGEALQRCTEPCCRGRRRGSGSGCVGVKQERQGGGPQPDSAVGRKASLKDRLPRIVQPQDSEAASSETSSSSSSSSSSPSSSPGLSVLPARCHQVDSSREMAVCAVDGGLSPAVVRVMVCDVQDTQV